MMQYTLCLSIIVLLATSFPTILIQSIFGNRTNRDDSRTIRAILIYNVILSLLVFRLIKLNSLTYMADRFSIIWLVLCIIIALILLMVEIQVSYVIACYKNRERIKLKLEFVGNIKNAIDCTCIIINSIFEEYIYRYVWMLVLIIVFDLPIALVILIQGLIFAYNHRLLGIEIVAGKFFTAIVLGIIFAYTGNLFYPIIIHILMNSIICYFSMRCRHE